MRQQYDELDARLKYKLFCRQNGYKEKEILDVDLSGIFIRVFGFRNRLLYAFKPEIITSKLKEPLEQII